MYINGCVMLNINLPETVNYFCYLSGLRVSGSTHVLGSKNNVEMYACNNLTRTSSSLQPYSSKLVSLVLPKKWHSHCNITWQAHDAMHINNSNAIEISLNVRSRKMFLFIKKIMTIQCIGTSYDKMTIWITWIFQIIKSLRK